MKKNTPQNPSSTPKVMVIVLNWHGHEDTIPCMNALAAQSYTDFHTILIDNGSSPDEKALLEAHYRQHERVTLIQHPTNLGFTKANNRIVEQLLQQQGWEALVLLNNDTIVDKEWLEALVRCAEETQSDMVGSKIVFMDDPEIIDSIGHYMLNTGEILPLGNGEPAAHYTERMEVFGACAGALLIKRSLIEAIGLFDPFFETGYEDAELGARSGLLGYRCTFEPRARVRHRGSASVKKIRDFDYLVRLEINVWYTYLKLMPGWVIALNAPFLLLKYLLILAGGLLAARPRISKIYAVALYRTFGPYRSTILRARAQFWQQHRVTAATATAQHRFFLAVYWRYFVRYVVQKRKSIFDN